MPKTYKCGCVSDGSNLKLCPLHFVIVEDKYLNIIRGKELKLNELKLIHEMIECDNNA